MIIYTYVFKFTKTYKNIQYYIIIKFNKIKKLETVKNSLIWVPWEFGVSGATDQ